MPAPKKSSAHKKHSLLSAKAAAKPVESMSDLADTFTTMYINKLQPEFNYIFPVILHHCEEGKKHVIYYDMQPSNHPSEYLHHARVLKGGTKLSVLWGFPKWICEELFLKKQMDIE